MLESLKKKKLLESLKMNKGGQSSAAEADKLEESTESPSFDASENENDEQVKSKKKLKK